jgi:hypothetical protein
MGHLQNMRYRLFIAVVIIGMMAGSVSFLSAQPKEKIMQATGTFEVQLSPQQDEQAPVGRMVINKVFSGDLKGTGTGQMISKRIEGGNAVYYAVEEVVATLDGKSGAFTLLHHGEMSASEQSLSISVMPGSGSGELAGISGNMAINIEEGMHSYQFSYTFE